MEHEWIKEVEQGTLIKVAEQVMRRLTEDAEQGTLERISSGTSNMDEIFDWNKAELNWQNMQQ